MSSYVFRRHVIDPVLAGNQDGTDVLLGEYMRVFLYPEILSALIFQRLSEDAVEIPIMSRI